MGSPASFQVDGSPPPWTVTRIDKFVVSALKQAERIGGELPDHFHLTFCPWGERNAIGGTPLAISEGADPRFRLVHFTGCGRPFLTALFIGEDAAARQQRVIRYLPWAEHYAVHIRDEVAAMRFVAATETPEAGVDDSARMRTLRELLHTGELAHF